MLVIACGLVAALILIAVIGLVILDLAGHLDPARRMSMLVLAAGLLWAGPDRFRQLPPGFGDLLFLIGVARVLVTGFWGKLWARVDAADGRRDGKFQPEWRPGRLLHTKRSPPCS